MAKCVHDRVRQTCSVCSPAQVFAAYRYKALNQRHIAFTLTLDQFKEIVKQACVFCGQQSEPRGIDRRDNRIGYVRSNCQSCCGPCNKLKGTFGEQIFLFLVFKIARHRAPEKQNRAVPSQLTGAATHSGGLHREVPAVPQLPTPRFQDVNLSPEARRFLNGI